MLDLADIPFFSPLPEEAIPELRRSVDVLSCPAGSVICRKGEEGYAFFIIASGGVTVQLGNDAEAGKPNVFLGPGQVFGEMSLLSDAPVSATVVAATDTWIYALSKDSFLHLLDTQPALHNQVLQVLIERIKHRTSPETATVPPSCAFVVISNKTPVTKLFRRVLFRVIEHYAPGSFFVDTVPLSMVEETAVDRPAFFPPCTNPLVCGRGVTDVPVYAVCESVGWVEDVVKNWRSHGSTGRYLILVVPEEGIIPLRGCLAQGDTVLVVEDRDDHVLAGLSEGDFGLASFGRVRFGSRRELDEIQRLGRWAFQLGPEEMYRADQIPEWNRSIAPTLDWIARWMTGREVGMALGAGAACGFAHLGVLQVLEEAGIEIDYICGSSMGGALALVQAMVGNANQAVALVREVAGGNDKVVDITWFPRSALLHGKKSKKVALRTWGNTTLAEFKKPSAAVAADLVRGGRFVFDRGLGSIAARATTAIPGIFPPIPHEGRLLVDGALVSRIPMDLLDRRRCGLKMAVNVIPSPEQRRPNDSGWRQMDQQFNHFLGLRHVIASSWSLLAWWQGTAESHHADIIFEPRTDKQAGYNFATIDAMIEAGRVAAQQKLALVQKSVETLMKPGAP